MSSLTIGQNDDSDRDGFESACQFLQQLRQNGNYAAKEFSGHLEAIRQSMVAFTGESDAELLMNLTSAPFYGSQKGSVVTPSSTTPGNTFQPTMTAEMALAEPSLQEFLSQADFDPIFLDTQIQGDQLQAMYYPMLQDEAWMAG